MRRYPMQEGIEDSAKLPNELMQFVKKDTYSLIIKGSAGTGKTTLSLTILRALEIKDNFFYICTRVSPRQLLSSYPWIAKIKETQTEETQKLATSEGDVPTNFEDARLDEPESLFERITNELMDVKAPLIIIDSWDAVASFMDREARLNNERVLQTWRERAGAKLIFVNENPTDSSLDFLVDGAVKLDQGFYENIRMREISFLKLRGIKIKKPSYVFTLNKGNFQSFQTYDPKNFVISLDSTNSPHFHKKKINQRSLLYRQGLIRSGYHELDINLGGGFPRRGIAAIEVESNVNIHVAMVFLFKIIVTFMKSGNVVLFEPPESVDPASLSLYLKSYLLSAQSDLSRFFWLGAQVDGLTEPLSSEANKNRGERLLDYLYKKVVKERQSNTNRLLLNILSLSRVHRLDSRNRLEHLSFARQNIDLTILVARENESILWTSDICDTMLKICVIKGSLFLKTLYPLTPILAMEVNKFSGYPMVRLIPLV
jgi:KaiC/GvpD/RAD55 family RecA-like ATPase